MHESTPASKGQMFRVRPGSRRARWGRVSTVGLVAGAALALGAVYITARAALPPVIDPVENPTTEPKRVLGKILFFDEQLSMSNTVACASCHVMPRGGADPRLARNPGPDGIFNTPDDRIASPGVINADANNDYTPDPTFGLQPQITSRAAPSPINAAFSRDLFWDGRASTTFIDPQTGEVAIANGGALESQSVNPPVSSVEKGHAGVNWNQITQKLGRVRPLDLATNLPPDVAAAIQAHPTYPQLFQQAFGDTQITARRIAFAIAAYERTLIADQTPWDRTQAGLPGGLTQGQLAGLQTFTQNCQVCHVPPLFADQNINGRFRNIGLRPTTEDLGRQIVTNNPADRGKFKVPSLRNVGLQASFMHNGQFTTLPQLVQFYVRAPGAAPQFPDNRDPAMNAIQFPPQAQNALVDFLANGLTDSRVASGQFPFDKPLLFGERQADRATIVGGGIPGSGGQPPRIIAADPGMIGNTDFRIGLDQALAGATARLAVSTVGPVNGIITQDQIIGQVTVSGTGNAGFATMHWPLNVGVAQPGIPLFMQWFIDDPAAPNGTAASVVARVPIFCGSQGCLVPCGYANCDGSVQEPILNINDFICFMGKFAAGDNYANCDGSTIPPVLNVNDFSCFLNRFAQGCQ